MVEYAKPLPRPDVDSLPFWEGCKAHELRGQRCRACNAFRWPPQSFCPHCYSWDFDWVKLDGAGTVYTYVVVHYVAVPAFADDVPYVIAQITLDGTDDRVHLLSNVIDCDPQQVKVGMRVQPVFEDVTDEITLPKFRPRPDLAALG